MTPIRFLTTNHSLAATISTTGTPVTGYPVANLKDPDRTKIWKEAAGTTELLFHMVGNPGVGALGITGMTYSVDTDYRLRGNTLDSGWDSAPFDTGWLHAYPSALGFGSGGFGEYGFGGVITPAQYPFFRPSLVCLFDLLGPTFQTWDGVGVQFWEYYKLGFRDVDYVVGDTIGAGVISLSTEIEMPQNFGYGWKQGVIDTSIIRESTGGQVRAARSGTRLDTVSLPFQNMDTLQRDYLFQELKSRGLTQPFFAVLFPDAGSPGNVFNAYYGTLSKFPSFDQGIPGAFTTSIEFRETP